MYFHRAGSRDQFVNQNWISFDGNLNQVKVDFGRLSKLEKRDFSLRFFEKFCRLEMTVRDGVLDLSYASPSDAGMVVGATFVGLYTGLAYVW